MSTLHRTLPRAIVAAGGLAALGLASQPLLGEPRIQALARSGIEALLVTGCVSGCVLIAGGAAHQLLVWSRALPPAAPALPVEFATSVDAAQLVYDERAADPDDPDQAWDQGIIRFAFFANCDGWGWRDLARYMGRQDWQACTRLLVDARVVQPARGKLPTAWAPGWNYPRFRMAVKHADLELTYPPGQPPPRIEWRRNVTQWRTQHARHAQHTH